MRNRSRAENITDKKTNSFKAYPNLGFDITDMVLQGFVTQQALSVAGKAVEAVHARDGTVSAEFHPAGEVFHQTSHSCAVARLGADAVASLCACSQSGYHQYK